MSERKESLPSFKELGLLWLVHLAAFAMLLAKGYLQTPQCFALLMATLVAFLSGARVERYRAKLEKIGGTDGAD